MIEFLVLRKIKNIINVDEKRDSKYKAFRRLDTFWFNRPWLYMTCHLSILKIVLCFFLICNCAFFCKIFTIGMKDKPLTGMRYFLIRVTQGFTSAASLFCVSSCIWVSNNRPLVCYKRYLGADWVPDYDSTRVACVVGNHSSFLDTPMNCLR